MTKLKQQLRENLVIVLILLMAIAGIVLWCALSPSWYLWPTSADDWAAWGTCIGAVGTILAVIYAAQTLKSTAAAQLEESRDRKTQMDFLEAQEAQNAKQLWPTAEGRSLEAYSADAAGGAIVVWNTSDEQSFHDVQVFVAEKSLEPGVTLTNIKVKRTQQIFDSFIDGWRVDEDSWEDITPQPVILPNKNYWSLGTVGPRECRKVAFDFSPPYEQLLDWTNQHNEVDGFSRPKKMLAVTYVDQKGREWLRTSQDRGKIKRIRLNELVQAAKSSSEAEEPAQQN